MFFCFFFFFSSRRRHTRWTGDWSSDVCSSDLVEQHDVWAALGNLLQPDGSIGRRRRHGEQRLFGDRRREQTSRHQRIVRSEERRVGKECRSRWAPYEENKKQRRERKTERLEGL